MGAGSNWLNKASSRKKTPILPKPPYDQAVASLDAENAAVVAAQASVASAQAQKEVA